MRDVFLVWKTRRPWWFRGLTRGKQTGQRTQPGDRGVQVTLQSSYLWRICCLWIWRSGELPPVEVFTLLKNTRRRERDVTGWAETREDVRTIQINNFPFYWPRICLLHVWKCFHIKPKVCGHVTWIRPLRGFRGLTRVALIVMYEPSWRSRGQTQTGGSWWGGQSVNHP